MRRILFESGWSESLDGRRNGAREWLVGGNGAVKAAIITKWTTSRSGPREALHPGQKWHASAPTTGVTQHHNVLKQKTSSRYYVKFTEVSRSKFESLSSDKSRPSKSIKLSYDDRNKTLVVKMPGPDHEITTGVFRELVKNELAAMEIKKQSLIKSSPKITLGTYTKEPDTCWGAKVTREIKFALEGYYQTVITISVGNHNDDSVIEKPITISIYAAHPTASHNRPLAAFRIASVVISHEP
ncbi:hypothetical protein CNMCM5793_002278 [Aspergillus hiratsukae]|uniref:Uncharacterized protein n=1 Tax=Aspergillus hiratsukae TaxID=1194566 RepID=A0A8H6UF75_9EURO|nr:hypothetical protein CNMCM5793_002278 [Aspergillus hiratsukae]KAF7166169.1 hypothetical protein CNMCM6106_002093 [Aspergillus hiratsukae]